MMMNTLRGLFIPERSYPIAVSPGMNVPLIGEHVTLGRHGDILIPDTQRLVPSSAATFTRHDSGYQVSLPTDASDSQGILVYSADNSVMLMNPKTPGFYPNWVGTEGHFSQIQAGMALPWAERQILVAGQFATGSLTIPGYDGMIHLINAKSYERTSPHILKGVVVVQYLNIEGKPHLRIVV